jgi:ABC-2 type transport system permease protein
MNKILVVLKRELNARVRTKAFIISTLLLPIMMVVFAVLPALLSRGSNRTLRVAIVDATGDSLGAHIESSLALQKLSHDTNAVARYELHRVATNTAGMAKAQDSLVAHTGISREKDPQALDGVLVLSDTTLRTGKLEYLGSNTSGFEAMGQLEGSISRVLTTTRLERAGVNPAVMLGAMTPADMQTVKVSDGKATGESGAASFIVAYVMGFILYLTMIIYGQQTLTSVIEEKTSRIMEVLMSSLRPFQMLLGKILGVGATGLLQLSIWGGTIFLVTSQHARIAHAFGVSADAMQQFPIPTMAPDLLVIFLLYFVLGFLLFGALYAAIGSMFNTVQEAQQVAMFVQMAIVVGFFTLFAVMKDPTGSLAVTASMIPFVSPFVMPARWSLTAVPHGELAVSLVLSVLALLAVTWIAGRIYRTGVLMYGKKPSLMEALRWIRAK